MKTLAEIIFEKIPAAMLERVVFDQNVIDESQRTALFKASGLSPQEVAQKTVEAYGNDGSKLASGLYMQIYGTDFETAGLLFEHFKSRPESEYYNHEASLIGHIPTLPMKGLADFLDTVEKKVCLIVSSNGNGDGTRGTGFLVAPDLVLTCRHVLKDFAPDSDIRANGKRIELYFDFYIGEPVEKVGALIHSARKVEVADQWHVESSADTIPDGVAGVLEEADKERISKALDFVLVRLAEPVGLQPLDDGGGRRRGWIAFSEDSVPQSLVPKDWIIIPQHPNGFPQRVDLGRFNEQDQTGTRIRYTTNTAHGTSGAPCFNEQFALVGIHNAHVGPEAHPLANQAIRFDYVAQLVRQHTEDAIKDAAAKAGSHALRWSVSQTIKDPRVILGRKTLLLWLQKSATRDPVGLSDRVYVARSNVPAAGCTFSTDVLHSEIRDTKTPRAVYGTSGQQLPATVEDFLLSLLRELEIDHAARIPPRPAMPGPGVPLEAGEIDKLERWISDELPNWLGRVIANHVEKEIDIRPVAQKLLEVYKENKLEPPEELKTRAQALEPILVRPNAWDFAYIALDGLRDNTYPGTGARTELKGEVRALIAALVKGKPESMMDPGLRRLRWMFLGYLPDFIAAADAQTDGATFEALDPATVGRAEILDVFDRISQAYLPTQELSSTPWPGVVARKALRTAGEKDAAEPRLVILQRAVNESCMDFFSETGN